MVALSFRSVATTNLAKAPTASLSVLGLYHSPGLRAGNNYWDCLRYYNFNLTFLGAEATARAHVHESKHGEDVVQAIFSHPT